MDPVAAHDALASDLGFEGSDLENDAEKRPASELFMGDGEEEADAEPPPPAPSSATPPPPPPPAAARPAQPRPDNSRMILDSRFVNSFEGRERKHTGISRMCQTCGYERNIYHIAAGLSDEVAARRLLNWEKVCPGRHESKAHKALGLPKVAGRLMIRCDS